MSPAPGALSAAIAGVHALATRRKPSPSPEDTTPPPPGSDSCYGVRSLDGSLDFVHHPHPHPHAHARARARAHACESEEDDNEHSDVSEPTSSSSSASEGTGADVLSAPTTSAAPVAVPTKSKSTAMESTSPTSSTSSSGSCATMLAPRPEAAPSPAVVCPTPSLSTLATESPPRLEGTPTPPAATRSPRNPWSPSLPAVSPRLTERRAHPLPPLPVSHALFDMLADAPSASEPSSPASLDSMCVTSLSSLSRTSSLLEDWRQPLDMDSDPERRGLSVLGLDSPARRPAATRGDTELVLPTLSLPSTSLHLGLERWNGPPSGTRVALLAEPERTRDVLGALAAKRKCVQLPHGHVGVVEGGRLAATVLTGLTAEDVRERVGDAYASLHSLLNPTANNQDLEGVIASYAARADWVHLVVPLDETSITGLEDAVPITTLSDERDRNLAQTARDDLQRAALAQAATEMISDPSAPPSTVASTSASSSHSPCQSPPLVDDTPPAREHVPAWSFHSRLPGVIEESSAHLSQSALSTSSLPDADILTTVSLLENVLDNPVPVTSASIAAFLAWRPARASTTSSISSRDGMGGAPLPTIRSVGAGAEWEATLSRRLAHRRELDAAARRARAAPPLPRRRRRRGSPSPPDECPGPGPLFPRRRMGTASVGLTELLDRVFAPVKNVLAKTSWTQLAVACAVAFAVGCGWWAVRAN